MNPCGNPSHAFSDRCSATTGCRSRCYRRNGRIRLRSANMSILWFKSNNIPKALAALGVFGSLLLAAELTGHAQW